MGAAVKLGLQGQHVLQVWGGGGSGKGKDLKLPTLLENYPDHFRTLLWALAKNSTPYLFCICASCTEPRY